MSHYVTNSQLSTETDRLPTHFETMWVWWAQCRQEGIACCWLKGQTWCCDTCWCTVCCAGRSPTDLSPSFSWRAEIINSNERFERERNQNLLWFAAKPNLCIFSTNVFYSILSKQEAAKWKDGSRPSLIETGSFTSVLLRSAINICCMWFCDLTTIEEGLTTLEYRCKYTLDAERDHTAIRRVCEHLQSMFFEIRLSYR